MKRTTQIIAMFFIFTLLASCTQKNEWEQLFNGKDLTGWSVICQPQDATKEIWVVDNGTIYCNTLDLREHHHVWLVSNKEYSDFELHLKFQAYSDSPGNSGIQFRSRYDADLVGGWMNGPQVDINPPERTRTWRTGLIYDETYEERRWIQPSLYNWDMHDKYKPKEYIMKYAENGDEWNELILICKGMRIKTIVNGIVCTDWDATGILDNENHRKHNIVESGHLAFQLHEGDRLKIRYKDVQIREL